MILVTGAAGFVGAAMVRRLAREGREVLAAVPARPSPASAARAEALSGLKGVRTLALDLSAPGAADALAVERFGTVLHLAAPASVRGGEAEAERALAALDAVLDAASDRAERVILASSSQVYGRTGRPPFKESVGFGPPASPYAAAKQEAERRLSAWGAARGVATCAVRLFSVYGPGARPDTVIERWIDAALAGRPVRIAGEPGVVRRDFTFVDDVAEAAPALVDAPALPPALNLCAGGSTPLDALANAIEALVGRPLERERAPLGPDELVDNEGSAALAQAVLGFRAATDLETGLARTLAARTA